MDPIDRFAARVKRIRQQRGWTQEELATKAQISRVFVARLETGARHDPSLSTVRALAKALGVSVASLVR